MIFDFHSSNEAYICFIMGFSRFLMAFLISISLELWGSKRSVLSFKSSKWRDFENESFPSLISQPNLIEAQKVETL